MIFDFFNKSISRVIVFIAITLLLSCKYDRIRIPPTPEIQVYLDSFLWQGFIRGFDYSNQVKDISFELTDIDDQNINGSCNRTRNSITLDSNDWKFSNPTEKEFLIAHELGHCLLNRDHDYTKTTRSECKSIMRGYENSFSCICNFYSSDWKKYYYDELFNPSLSPEIDSIIYQNRLNLNHFNLTDTIQFVSDTIIHDNIFRFLDSFPINPNKNYLLSVRIKDFQNSETNFSSIYFNNFAIIARKKEVNALFIDSPLYPSTIFLLESNELNFTETNLDLAIIFYQQTIRVFANGKLLHGFAQDTILDFLLNPRTGFLDGTNHLSLLFCLLEQ